MKYTELIFSNNQQKIENEIIIAYLGELGFESFTEEDNFLFAYIPTEIFSEDTMLEFLGEKFSSVQITYKISEVEEQNWNAVWEQNFDHVIIPGRCRIRAPFHEPDPAYPLEIIIEPKMSFGTAHHETTFMMMDLILDLDLAGKVILDVGSGTGILAILAAKLGASRILAIDNDDWAYRNAIENKSLNDALQVEVLLGDANSIPDESFDVIFANINRNILLRDMQLYIRQLKPGGLLLLSGFYEDDQNVISVKTTELNLQRDRFLTKNRWMAEVFHLNSL